MTEQEPTQKKPTLSDFIEENSKLVTSLAVFIALTAFSLRLDKPEGTYVSGIALFGAVLLTCELWVKMQFLPKPRNWRLELFDFVVMGLLFSLGYYWFSHFPQLWFTFLIFAVVPLLFLLILALLGYYTFESMIKAVAAMLFKRTISAERLKRVSSFASLSFVLLLLGCLFWIFHRIHGH